MSSKNLNQITSWSDYESVYKCEENNITKTNANTQISSRNTADEGGHASTFCQSKIKETIESVIEMGLKNNGGEENNGNKQKRHTNDINTLYEIISLKKELSSSSLQSSPPSSLVAIDRDNENDEHLEDKNRENYGNNINNDENDDNERNLPNEEQETTKFKMQWMRPHPALFFQLADEIKKAPRTGGWETGNNTSTNTTSSSSDNSNDDTRGDSASTCQHCSSAAKASRIVNYYNKDQRRRLRDQKQNIQSDDERNDVVLEDASRERGPTRKRRKIDADNNEGKNRNTNINEEIDGTEIIMRRRRDDEYANFLQYPTLHMDLAELISPHLLSQWIPSGIGHGSPSFFFDDQSSSSTDVQGKDLDCLSSYEYDYRYVPFDEESNHDDNNNDGHNNDNNNKHPLMHNDGTINTIIQCAIQYSKHNISTQSNKEKVEFEISDSEEEYSDILSNIRRRTNSLEIENIKKMTQEQLSNVLPSYLLMEKIQRYNKSGKLTLKVVVTALIVLVSVCSSPSMGIHVVKILYPSLIFASKRRKGSDNTLLEEDNDLTTGDIEAIRVLSRLIVDKCELSKLSKIKFREVLIRDDEERSSMPWNELKMSISKAFYQYR